MKLKWSPKRFRFDLREDLWRVLAVLGVLALLNLGFYLLLNLPRLRALDDLTSGRDEVQQALVSRSRTCRSLRELILRYDEESERLHKFYDERLGRQIDRMTTIQKEIRAVAVRFHIDPDSIDYRSGREKDSELTQFGITIPLVGGYPNLRQFIEEIESSERLFIIDSVELSGSRGGGAMLSLTIRISTYFTAPEEESGDTVAQST